MSSPKLLTTAGMPRSRPRTDPMRPPRLRLKPQITSIRCRSVISRPTLASTWYQPRMAASRALRTRIPIGVPNSGIACRTTSGSLAPRESL